MAMRTPESYTTGGGNATLYWLTQPWVAGRYFSAFFAPVHLSADNDWTLVSGWSDPRTLIGFAFVAALLWTIVRAARSRLSAPIAFGLGWFAIALLPTSLTPLAEVANDHRMFFPFVGLTLAATWTLWLLLDLLREFHLVRRATVPVTAAMLIACAVGVHERNEVWRSDETLWLDVTRKSPMNGRGWMNYGLARMAQADYATAIDSFERARTLTPDYSLVHINLGIAFGAVGRTADAERAFRRAQDLAPDDWRSHYYYARWLGQVGRTAEALSAAATAVSQNPADEASRVLLARLRATTPDDPDALVARSLAEYRAGQYRESLASAASALRLRPDYAEAYNNMAAAHNAMGEWDAGIIAATEAIRLKPGLQIAQNNLAYARQQKAREAAAAATGKRD
jgi:Flp pilus assembly protein TadD